MGKTWKNDTMFDSVFIKDNMQSLLFNSGVETISVEYEKQDTFESLHKQISILSEEVDYILGYSFGSYLALASATKNVKGIMLLDPHVLNGNDAENFIEDKQTAKPFFERDILNKNNDLRIQNFAISNYRPELLLIFSEYGSKNNELQKYAGYLNFYKTVNQITIDNSSHLLMLENARFNLADTILDFMNNPTTCGVIAK